jgi:hypothetical protein
MQLKKEGGMCLGMDNSSTLAAAIKLVCIFQAGNKKLCSCFLELSISRVIGFMQTREGTKNHTDLYYIINGQSLKLRMWAKGIALSFETKFV